LRANVDRLARVVSDADADLVVAPELAIIGYPPRDLLDSTSFVSDAVAALDRLVRQVRGPALVVGSVVGAGDDPLRADGKVCNGAVLIRDGAIQACHRKILLPSYDVFDETRYFEAGRAATVVDHGGVRLGLTVCEDIWNDGEYWRETRYDRDPAAETFEAGAQLLLNVSASPYARNKNGLRLDMLGALARQHRRPVLYANQVGGNDSLIFDGRSVAVDRDANVTWRLPPFREVVGTARFDGQRVIGVVAEETGQWEEDVVEALCLGLRDYLAKCGFSHVVVGLSGGIDSALTAAIAVRSLGADKVVGVAMPSRYSSQSSRDDAIELAGLLGIRVDTVSIEPMLGAYLASLGQAFGSEPKSLTEQNLQARIRGALLMAYSNDSGALLLTTGNKSEIAVGYATLYGDMCGGLAVISDLYKTQVYAVSRYLNASGAVIPESTLNKPPSAELAPDQTDQDDLPPYEILDPILEAYIDELVGYEALLARGFDQRLVHKVLTMVDRAEYKRRQMAPGLRVSAKAFGEGRRLPIAQRYVR
jgi:NAD+ synthetase